MGALVIYECIKFTGVAELDNSQAYVCQETFLLQDYYCLGFEALMEYFHRTCIGTQKFPRKHMISSLIDAVKIATITSSLYYAKENSQTGNCLINILSAA